MSTKMKINKTNLPFTMISNDVICSSFISCKAKAVYCYLFSRPEGWEFYHVEIQKHFKESKNTIKAALKELEECQLITRKQNNKGGVFGGVTITLNTKPVDNSVNYVGKSQACG